MLRRATTTVPCCCCCCCCCCGRAGRLQPPHTDSDADSDSDCDTDSESDEARALVAPAVLVRELGDAAPLAAGLTRSSFRNARRLARAIQSGVYVLFITGAGVSVASGIRTFRTGTDGLWNNFVYEVCVSTSPSFCCCPARSLSLLACLLVRTTQWGTKKKFMTDPAAWWTDFWLRAHDTDAWAHAVPSAGHIAIARIMQFAQQHPFTCH